MRKTSSWLFGATVMLLPGCSSADKPTEKPPASTARPNETAKPSEAPKPKEPAADGASVYYDRAVRKVGSGEDAGAASDYKEAVRLDPEIAKRPDYGDAFLKRGAEKRKKGKDYAGAKADCSMAVSLKPDDADAYYELGMAKDKLGDLEGALADLSQAIRLNRDHPRASYARGTIRTNKGDLDGATSDLSEAIRIAELSDATRVKTGTIAYYNRAVAKEKNGDFDGAFADYDKAIALKPDDARYVKGKALCKGRKERADTARPKVIAAIQALEGIEVTSANAAQVWSQLKEALDRTEKVVKDRALIASLAKILERIREPMTTVSLTAAVQARDGGDPKLALEHADRALAAAPVQRRAEVEGTRTPIAKQYAAALIEQAKQMDEKDCFKSQRLLRRALELDPASQDAREALPAVDALCVKHKPIDATFANLNSMFGDESKWTDLKKEREWAKYEGRTVRWTGEVVEVEKVLGSVTMSVKHLPDTFTSDVLVVLRDEEAEKARELAIGSRVTYEGRLAERPGAVLSLRVEDAVIVGK